MMWWPYGGSGWMLVMMAGWVALLAVGIWAVVALTRSRPQPPAPPRAEAPGEILDRRFAAGEITTEEYLEARALMKSRQSTPQTPA